MIDSLISIAKSAGEEILKIYAQEDIHWQEKSDQTPLTLADQASHDVITCRLKKHFPDIPQVSEEDFERVENQRQSFRRYFLIDPLDGTKEFIKRNDEFTVNIALIEEKKPVAGVVYCPALDLMFYAQKSEGAYLMTERETIKLPLSKQTPGILKVVASRSHMNEKTKRYIESVSKEGLKVELVSCGSSLKIVRLASGEADLYPRLAPTSEWDTAAAQAILEESGGKIVLASDEAKNVEYTKKDILNPEFIAKRAGLIL